MANSYPEHYHLFLRGFLEYHDKVIFIKATSMPGHDPHLRCGLRQFFSLKLYKLPLLSPACRYRGRLNSTNIASYARARPPFCLPGAWGFGCATTWLRQAPGLALTCRDLPWLALAATRLISAKFRACLSQLTTPRTKRGP